MNGGSR
ncbi:MAG: LacI family transcriptional regulator, partial [Porphyrobacter sp. HL-46]